MTATAAIEGENARGAGYGGAAADDDDGDC